jgi:hypothetical protein
MKISKNRRMGDSCHAALVTRADAHTIFPNSKPPPETFYAFLLKYRTKIALTFIVVVGFTVLIGAIIATGGFAAIPSAGALWGWMVSCGIVGTLTVSMNVFFTYCAWIASYNTVVVRNIIALIIERIPENQLERIFHELLKMIASLDRDQQHFSYSTREIYDMMLPRKSAEELRTLLQRITRDFPGLARQYFRREGYWPAEVNPLYWRRPPSSDEYSPLPPDIHDEM